MTIVHETRLKKNLIRNNDNYNFVNNIFKQQTKITIFEKQLKNVKITKNRSKLSKFVNKNNKNKFSFIKNINFKQNNVLDQKSSLSNFFII